MKRHLFLSISALACLCPVSAMAGVIASVDLSKPFETCIAWRFTATQGSEVEDPTGPEGEKAPGKITLCISKDGGKSCSPDVPNALRLSSGDDLFSEPHFLTDARIVYPQPHHALFLLQVASFHSGNGDQRVATQLLSYDPAKNSFAPVYAHQTGRNNNQEIRYIDTGPLRGDMISAEPTEDAPFGYWMTVNAPSSVGGYRQVLRYRSATRYGDGNSLAAIDSEMPEIQQRLGLWHTGMPLPLPKGGCVTPHLIKHVLWCA